MSTVTEWYRKVSFDFYNQEVTGALSNNEGSVKRREWESDKSEINRWQGIMPFRKSRLEGKQKSGIVMGGLGNKGKSI